METYENFEEYLEENYGVVAGTKNEYYIDMGGHMVHISHIEEEYQHHLDSLKE